MDEYIKKDIKIETFRWFHDKPVAYIQNDEIENINACPICHSKEIHGEWVGNKDIGVCPGDYIVIVGQSKKVLQPREFDRLYVKRNNAD